MTDKLEQHWPDAWFAGRFLPRERRRAATSVFALLHQLAEVVCGQACDSGACGCGPDDERRRVAMSILDHVWRGEATGRADLDAFAAVAAERPLQRVWFEAWIDAMLVPTPPRTATWKRLRERLEAASMPLASIGAAVLGGEASAQTAALVTAMRLTRLLERVPADAAAGRLALPLEDLVKHGLTDREVLQLSEDTTDARWRHLAAFEADRVRTLFDGGVKAVAGVTDGGARRAVSVLCELERQRLERCAAALARWSSAAQPASLGGRLTALPRAMRAAILGASS